MRESKRIFLFLIASVSVQADLFSKQAFSIPDSGYYDGAAACADIALPANNLHVQSEAANTNTFSGKEADGRIAEKEKTISRSNNNPRNGIRAAKKEILRKRSDLDPNAGGKKNSLFKDILIAVALALLSVAVGVFLVIGITLLFPTMSPQGILLIAVVVTAVLSVVVPRLLKQ